MRTNTFISRASTIAIKAQQSVFLLWPSPTLEVIGNLIATQTQSIAVYRSPTIDMVNSKETGIGFTATGAFATIGTVYRHGIGLPGQLQDSFEANDTENDVSPICNDSRVKHRTTVLNCPVEAKTGENCPAELPDCPACGRCEWTISSTGDLLCPCGHKQGSNK